MNEQANDTAHQILTLKWTPEHSVVGSRRTRKPLSIESYLPLPIAERSYLLDTALAATLVEAESSCRALAQLGEQFGLDSIARQLLRSESVASSQIEGYAISSRRLARAAVSGGHDVKADTVLGNVAAVARAIELGGGGSPISLETFISIHHRLLEGTSSARVAGTLRTAQNWIGGNASSPADAEFIPPPPELVEPLLVDLAEFCNRDDLPAVLQAAVAHAQFETIHPFVDGNGRAGRALILLVLLRRGTIGDAVPPVSLFLAGTADAYVKGLTNYRFSPADDWFVYFAEIVRAAAESVGGLAADVNDLQEHWRTLAGNPRAGSAASKLIAVLPSYPVLTLGSAISITGASDEACRRALNALEECGVLSETTSGRRNRVWETVGLFALLDEFEHSASGGRIRSAGTQH